MRDHRRCDADRSSCEQTLRCGGGIAGVENYSRDCDCIFYRTRRRAARIGASHYKRLSATSIARAGLTQGKIDMLDPRKRGPVIRNSMAFSAIKLSRTLPVLR